MTDPCVICVQNIDTKAKPGIFPCLGCKQMFCTRHVAFHRQELANELDLIIGNRNELQDILDHREDIPNVSAQMNLIHEWVEKTIAQVYQIADNVRQQIIRRSEEQKMSFKDQFAELSKKIDIFRENENFYEKDIEKLKERCTDLKHLLNQVDINVFVTDISSSLARAVTLQQKKEKLVETPSVIKQLSFVEDLVTHKEPYKRIKIPHNGSVYMGTEIVLLHSDDNFTLIDLKTNSLRSIYVENSCYLVFCWSVYLNGLLYADPRGISKIGLFKVAGQSLTKVKELPDAIDKISCMVCFLDQMMLVCHGTKYNNHIEERSLTGFYERPVKPTNQIHCWRPPLTCASQETVANISFDNKRIVLLITDALRTSKNRIEFRTRNMYVIGHLMLNDYNKAFSSILCRLNDGWLFGDRNRNDSPWCFTLIDHNLNQHKQKLLSTYGIIKIEIVKYEQNKSILAIYRENGCASKLTYDRSKLLLDLYVI